MAGNGEKSHQVTMSEIAAALGVSNVTVSNALAGRKGVSERTRLMVEAKARELGYFASREQPSQQGVVADNIGIIMPERCYNASGGFYQELHHELIAALRSKERYAVLDLVPQADETALNLSPMIRQRQVAGLVLLGCPELRFLTEICKCGLPVVFLNFSVRDFDFDSITGNDFHDMYRLTSYLITRGHSRIAFVGDPDSGDTAQDLYFGYLRALAENEIERDDSLLVHCLDADSERITPSLPDVLPTAFVCSSAENAAALMSVLNAQGIRVPDDVSLACCTDGPTSLKDLNLTCVRRDASRMARLAANILLEKMGAAAPSCRMSVSGRIHSGNTVKTKK